MDCETNSRISFQYQEQKFVILEALSATGLRSIRYAKEIPSVKSVPYSINYLFLCSSKFTRYVIANDLSPTAAEAMRRNVDLNGLGEQMTSDPGTPDSERKTKPAKVRVNEGDAW